MSQEVQDREELEELEAQVLALEVQVLEVQVLEVQALAAVLLEEEVRLLETLEEEVLQAQAPQVPEGEELEVPEQAEVLNESWLLGLQSQSLLT